MRAARRAIIAPNAPHLARVSPHPDAQPDTPPTRAHRPAGPVPRGAHGVRPSPALRARALARRAAAGPRHAHGPLPGAGHPPLPLPRADRATPRALCVSPRRPPGGDHLRRAGAAHGASSRSSGARVGSIADARTRRVCARSALPPAHRPASPSAVVPPLHVARGRGTRGGTTRPTRAPPRILSARRAWRDSGSVPQHGRRPWHRRAHALRLGLAA